MKEFLLDLGFQKYDLALLVLCPIGAVIGSYAHAILQVIDPHRMPRPGTTRFLSSSEAMGRFAWLVQRLSLGAILGLVIALYFIGALQENLTTLAKIVALSVLLGFAAPKLWVAQERIVIDQTLKLLREMLPTSPKVSEPPESGSNPAVNTDAAR